MTQLYSNSERQHSISSTTSTLALLITQDHDNFDNWYYSGIVINPRSGLPTTITGIRGPANLLAERIFIRTLDDPIITRRQAYIQRTSRSLWNVVQLLPFTKAEHTRLPDSYINIWY